ncbi:MAG: chemotaxis protein, partial [Limnobacter sp.]|nr:chemotaxis protein [Limnobacter sp.]
MNSSHTVAGSSVDKIEILLFSLGGSEIFGINVFKIREVTEMMEVTKMPGGSQSLLGMVSLRGNVLPVLDLAKSVGMVCADKSPEKLIIAEFASRTVAFAVHAVDKIVRIDWSEVKPPQRYDAEGNFISGVILLNNDRLVSLLDIEAVCQRELPMEDTEPVTTFDVAGRAPVFFVDDSKLARKQITHVLDSMGLTHMHAINGDDAQQKLLSLVAHGPNGGDASQKLSLVLVDEEMPGMDGCALTKLLRSDNRFKNT